MKQTTTKAKALLASALAILAATIAAPANDSLYRWTFDGGLAGHTGKYGFIGADFGLACQVTDNSRVGLNFGIFTEINPKVYGHYYYTHAGSSVVHRGDWQLEHDYMPLLFSWEYTWKVDDSLSFRVGPTIGLATVVIAETRSVKLSDAYNTRNHETLALGMLGANAAVRYTFPTGSDLLFYTELGMRALVTTETKTRCFGGNGNNERVNLSGVSLFFTIGMEF